MLCYLSGTLVFLSFLPGLCGTFITDMYNSQSYCTSPLDFLLDLSVHSFSFLPFLMCWSIIHPLVGTGTIFIIVLQSS